MPSRPSSFISQTRTGRPTRPLPERRLPGAIPELSRSIDLLPTKEVAGMLSKSYEAIGDKENGRKYAEMAQ